MSKEKAFLCPALAEGLEPDDYLQIDCGQLKIPDDPLRCVLAFDATSATRTRGKLAGKYLELTVSLPFSFLSIIGFWIW
jgi:hypothetical protein